MKELAAMLKPEAKEKYGIYERELKDTSTRPVSPARPRIYERELKVSMPA